MSRSNISPKCAASLGRTSSVRTARSSTRSSEVARLPAIPHGTIRSKYRRSVATLYAKPCEVTQRLRWTPRAASFSSVAGLSDPDAVAIGNARGGDFEISCRADHDFLELLDVPADVAAMLGKIKDGVADDLAGAVIGDVATAVGFVEGDIHLREQVIAGAEIFFFSVAAQRDYVRVLAEEQDVGNGAGLAGFDELLLERACWGVGQHACVYLPADFFWLLHETIAVSGGLPPISIAITAQARLPMLPKPLHKFLHRALVVDAQTAHGVECVAHCFPYRRVSMDRGGHVVERGFEAERCYRLGDNFRGERADGVHAENFAVLLLRLLL